MSDAPQVKPTINVNATTRQILYAITAVGSLVCTYLGAKGTIGTAEIAAWSGWVTLVSSLAVSKTDTSRAVKAADTEERTPEGLPIV